MKVYVIMIGTPNGSTIFDCIYNSEELALKYIEDNKDCFLHKNYNIYYKEVDVLGL